MSPAIRRPRARAILVGAAGLAGLLGLAGEPIAPARAEPPGLTSQAADAAPAGAGAGPIAEPEPPGIELWTFGVGERIFEKYGHAALCLTYHQPAHAPVCFNYGVTNFAAGAMIAWNFVRRQQGFWAEARAQDDMQQFYAWEDRDIWRQRLPIAGAEARALEARLWRDVEPAHRGYVYDHFRDNCTTRLRDLIDDATHGALRAGGEARYPLSLRDLGLRGLAGLPVLRVASDLVAGRQLDAHPTRWEAMFLPDILRAEVAARLGAVPEPVHRRAGPPFPDRAPTSWPAWLAAGVALAGPLALARWRGRRLRAARAWATLPLALLGAIAWGLAIASPIEALRYNEAVFVVAPIDAILPWLPAAGRRRYARLRLGLLALVSLLGAIGVFRQPLQAVIAAVFLPFALLAFEPADGRAAARGEDRPGRAGARP